MPTGAPPCSIRARSVLTRMKARQLNLFSLIFSYIKKRNAPETRTKEISFFSFSHLFYFRRRPFGRSGSGLPAGNTSILFLEGLSRSCARVYHVFVHDVCWFGIICTINSQGNCWCWHALWFSQFTTYLESLTPGDEDGCTSSPLTHRCFVVLCGRTLRICWDTLSVLHIVSACVLLFN